jgi:hypothetical protein
MPPLQERKLRGLLDDHHKAEELLAERFEEGEHGAAQLADGPPNEEAQARRIRRSLWLGRAGELSCDVGRDSLLVC